MLSNELKQQAEQKLIELIALVRKTHPDFPDIHLGFDLTGYRICGRANVDYRTKVGVHQEKTSFKIQLNSDLFPHNVEYFLTGTLPHEVAHLVDFHLTGTMSHGPSWKRIMVKMFGRPAKRLVNEDDITIPTGIQTRRKATTHEYKCSCDHFTITAKRHALIQKGHRYACRKCGVHIYPVDSVREVAVPPVAKPQPKKQTPARPDSTFAGVVRFIENNSQHVRKGRSSILINEIQAQFNVSQACARTYYYKAKGMLSL